MISSKTHVCRLTQSCDKAVANKIVSHCVAPLRSFDILAPYKLAYYYYYYYYYCLHTCRRGWL